MTFLTGFLLILFVLIWAFRFSETEKQMQRKNRNYRKGERIRQAIQEHKEKVEREAQEKKNEPLD